MDAANPTLCETCDHVAADSRRDHPRFWLCTRHRRLPGFGFVTHNPHPRQAPYLHCIDVNGGACPLWTPRRLPEESSHA